MKANLAVDDEIVSHVQAWLSTVVIGLGLCPFAKPEFDNGRIHYTVIKTNTLDDCAAAVVTECAALDKTKGRETSLLILPNVLKDFYAFLDVIDRAEAELKSRDYEGVYQLASFHPDYLFAEVNPKDASHYTNRSPYPIIHILREASVEAAVETYDNPEKIPKRNVQLTRKMGVSAMRDLLAACYNN